ncbi:MAG: GTP-dependent dephospho-CoA kinase family protein [Halobacteriales archaeon]
MPAEDGTDPDVLLRLPESARGAFKAPIGPVFAEAAELLATADRPLVAVGDVVAATLVDAGVRPAVMVVDGRTERAPVDESVAAAVAGVGTTVRATNPPATITRSLVEALASALRADGPTRVVVDGEEDLAVLPAVLLAPTGATVVYGQPGEGMVAVAVTPSARETAERLLDRLEGDHEATRRLLDSG